MFSTLKRSIAALIALLAVTATVSSVQAQYPRGYGYGYPSWGPANAGYGQAAVMNAQSGLLQSSEQARILREQANQAKLETKKQTLDWKNYERANTPTYGEEQERNKALILRRMMNKPMEAEIVQGQVQNVMLPYLQQLLIQGTPGTLVPLDPEQLKQINVAGATGGNVGILRNGGQVDWPLPVRGPTQKRLATLLPQVVSQTAQNELDPVLYKQVRDGVSKMQDDLRMQFRKEEIDGGTYLLGKRFLDSLETSVNTLQQPGTAKLLNGTYTATGRNVPELVYNMNSKGLKFAPCAPGGEEAYHALYNAMMAYAAGDQNNSGFRVQLAPQPTQSQGKFGPN